MRSSQLGSKSIRGREQEEETATDTQKRETEKECEREFMWVEVNSGVNAVDYDSVVMDGLHQQLQLHMLMTLDTGQGHKLTPPWALCVCVCACVSEGLCVSTAASLHLEWNEVLRDL